MKKLNFQPAQGCHPSVAYVAAVDAPEYRGAGLVEVYPDMTWSYVDAESVPGAERFYNADRDVPPAFADAARPGHLHAVASCGEIVVVRGTALAAYLLAAD